MLPVARVIAVVATVYMFVHSLAVNVRPLLNIPGGGSFYTVPKMINLGIWMGLIVLALVVTLAGVRNFKGFGRLFRDPLILAFTASLITLATAPFLSTRTPLNIAFLGYEFRFDGPYVILFSLIIAASIAWFVMLDRRFATIGLWTFLGLTIFNAIFGIMQGQGIDVWAALGVQGLGARPPRTTLGNPAFASLIPAMGAVIVANLLMDEGIRERRWKLLTVLGIGLLLAFAAGSSSSRSAVVGFWFVLATSTIINTIRVGRGRQMLYPLLITGLMLGAQWLGTSANSYAEGKFAALNRMVTGLEADNSWTSRLRFWDIAIDAIQEQPILPYGSGAYAYVMWEYADEQQTKELYAMFVPDELVDFTVRQENILIYPGEDGQNRGIRVNSDKAHNYILDIWMSYGLFATIALVAFLVLLLARLIQANTALTWSVVAAGTVYGFFSMAWFPAVATDPLVFGLLGVGWGLAERELRGVPDDEAAVPVVEVAAPDREVSRAERRRRENRRQKRK